LEENTEYVVRIRAYTKQGAGPFSEKIIIETERDMGRAPMSGEFFSKTRKLLITQIV
jgi:receptor-type tyrosine-protein phosphatase F